MAKIYKVLTYIVDPNEMYDDYEEILNYTGCEDVYYTTAKAEQVSLEWVDELPINFSDCPIEEFEKYFKE
jgi:hypothetical protein